MIDQLERDLRDAFAARAAEVPVDSALRLGAIEFRPQTRPTARRWVVGSLSGAAAATAAVVPVLVLGGAQPAFAGWTAAPAAAAAPSTPASTACEARLAEMPVPGEGTAGWSPVATDVRGPYTFVVYADGQAFATCFTGPSFTVVSAATSGTETGNGVVTMEQGNPSGPGSLDTTKGSVTLEVPSNGSTGDVQRAIVSHLDLSAANGGAYTMVEGQGSSGLTGVTLVRSDGSTVQATVGSGWFVAWWPGDLDVTSATVSTAAGESTVTFSAEPWLNPSSNGSGSCPQNPADAGSGNETICSGGATQSSGQG